MIDFVEKVRERNGGSVLEAAITIAFLKCAEELTEQICCLALATNMEEMDMKSFAQTLKDGLPLIGKMEYWTVAAMCYAQGQNLIDFGKALECTAGEPGANQRAEIANQLKERPRQFKENLDKTGAEPLFMQCLSHCMKYSGLDKAGEEQQ